MFVQLNAGVADLRSSLRSFVGERALSEVTIRPPAGQADEASFLRLVAWSYALVFEAGRVTIPYLLDLPDATPDAKPNPKAARHLVHDLRTWGFHNLGFSNDQDLAVSQRSQMWFVSTCGAYPPNDSETWQTCFLALCSEVEAIVAHCQVAMVQVLSSTDDGQAATADLRRRIDRVWPAYEFDKLIGDAAVRLGIRVDARKFREPRLPKWRGFLESIPGGDDPESQMIRMIERDLLDYVEEVLPIDGRDVMSTLGLAHGPEVGIALHRARELFRCGIRDREQLLSRLETELPSIPK